MSDGYSGKWVMLLGFTTVTTTLEEDFDTKREAQDTAK